jgi:hypothetical protein
MSVNEIQVLNTAIGRRLDQRDLIGTAALSRQLGVRVADDKELLAADQAPDRGVSAGGFPASLGATEKVAVSSVTVCRGACLTIWARSSSTSGVKERNPS